MKPLTMHLTVPLITILMLMLPLRAETRPDCSEYRDEFRNIQSQLKHGYNVKQGEKLKIKEQRARKLWWLCTKNMLPKKYLLNNKAAKKPKN